VVLKVTHVLDNIALGDYAVKRVFPLLSTLTKKVAVGDNHDYLIRVINPF